MQFVPWHLRITCLLHYSSQPFRIGQKRVKLRVLIFDSGVGGLSIYQHIQARLPDASCDYLMDNALFPYGELAESRVIERICALVACYQRDHCADFIVIACNSASTLVLPALREQTQVPVIGVVPAIKPAAKNGCAHIGLLATPGTVARSYTDKLINDFAAHCRVTRIGSSQLVRMAEGKIAGERVTMELLRAELAQWLLDPPDAIVLGCTHFPLLKTELAACFSHAPIWVDSGEAIARRLQQLASSEGARADLEDAGKRQCQTLFSTAETELLRCQWPHFIQQGFDQHSLLTLD